MKNLRLPIVALLVPLLFTSIARADLPEAVTRHIDSSTLLVVRGDVSKLDVDASMQFVRSLIADAPEADRAEFEEMLGQMEEALTQAQEGLKPVIEAGATEAYMVVSPAPLMQQVPPVVIVPIGDEAQRDAVLAFLRQIPMKHEPVEGAVLVGEQAAIAAATATRPEPRPELEEAFAGDRPDRAASAVFAPTPLVTVFGLQALREAAKESPAVPAELADTLAKLTLASVDISLPPEPSGVIEMRFADEGSAEQMHTFLEAMRQLGKAQASEELGPEAAESVSAAVAPEQDGSAIRIEITSQELKEALGGPMIAAVQQAREDAQRVQAMGGLKQIGMGIHMYANDQDGMLPESLDEITPYIAADEQQAREVLTSARVDAEVGFIYVKPAEKLSEVKDSARRVLAYEKLPAEPAEDYQAVVLFVDGHVEAMPVERLRKLAQEQGFEIETLE